jgi:hypothetical protein
VVAPLGLRPLLAFAGAFGDGKVRHEVIGRGTVSVPLTLRGVDGVAGSHLSHICAAGLDPAVPFSHIQGLAVGMPMPMRCEPQARNGQCRPVPERVHRLSQ